MMRVLCLAAAFLFAGAVVFADTQVVVPVQKACLELQRVSGDEFFYTLRGVETPQCSISKGDTLTLTGAGVVKGFVAPFRDAAKKEFGGWIVSKHSSAQKVVFEAACDAHLTKPLEGFILLGRMGASKKADGTLGTVAYRYGGKGFAAEGEVPGPYSPASP